MIAVLLIYFNLYIVYAQVPVVLWHGMGDSCCNPFSMGYFKELIEKNIPGVYVYSIRVGNGILEDTKNGFFKNVNDQIEEVCNTINKDSRIPISGYHAVGFSQGGQFLRALAQRCPDKRILNLISIGGQHQGVFGVPHCPNGYYLCEQIRKWLNQDAYKSFIQNNIVQAEYWHDPLQEDEYKLKNIFLPDINQENAINETYRQSIINLQNFVLIKFNNDTMVNPIESEWFGFYAPGQDKIIMTLEESALYIEDRLGLRWLNDAGHLIFLSLNGDHLQFTEEWFVNEIVLKYLNQHIS